MDEKKFKIGEVVRCLGNDAIIVNNNLPENKKNRNQKFSYELKFLDGSIGGYYIESVLEKINGDKG